MIWRADSPDAWLKSNPRGPEKSKRVQQRQRTLKDAWLTHVGHARPGMAKGKPLADAEQAAAEVTVKIRALTGATPE